MTSPQQLPLALVDELSLVHIRRYLEEIGEPEFALLARPLEAQLAVLGWSVELTPSYDEQAATGSVFVHLQPLVVGGERGG